MFCRSLSVFLSFFSWPLHCLYFFDLRLLITLLVSFLRNSVIIIHINSPLLRVCFTNSIPIFLFPCYPVLSCTCSIWAGKLHWLYKCLNLAFIIVYKPQTHKLFILRQCTIIVYLSSADVFYSIHRLLFIKYNNSSRVNLYQ